MTTPLPAALKSEETPATIDIDIVRGDTFYLELQLQDNGTNIDISGNTAVAKVRDAFGAVSPLLTFTCTIPTGTDGIVRLYAAPAATVALAMPVGTSTSTRRAQIGYWDVDISDGTEKRTFAIGAAWLIIDANT
jgi:hypothetical protein